MGHRKASSSTLIEGCGMAGQVEGGTGVACPVFEARRLSKASIRPKQPLEPIAALHCNPDWTPGILTSSAQGRQDLVYPTNRPTPGNFKARSCRHRAR